MSLFKDAPLYVQPSVGVPLGGGVLAALDDVLRGLRGSDRGMEIAHAGRDGPELRVRCRARLPGGDGQSWAGTSGVGRG